MWRRIENQLVSWKNKSNRKPLILNGARQVGKTYILKEFGKKFYTNTIYVNLERNKDVFELFNNNIEPIKIIQYLEVLYNVRIEPDNTLIFLDEIQACERALTSLKYFYEDAPEYHIVTAGSLLGVAINRDKYSFPVGKVDIYTLYPLDFEEFLIANDKVSLRDTIKECYQNHNIMPEVLHRLSIDMYKNYLILGGMPESVRTFLETNSFYEALEVQSAILDSYIADMSKYATNTEAVKIRLCFDSIPNQLAKENKKFQYKVVRKGGSSAYFDASLDWLNQAGLILKCQRIEHSQEPLTAQVDLSAFKVYMLDVGLLVNKAGYSYQTIQNNQWNTFMGAITENFVAQQLVCKGNNIYYWTKDNSTAELDFIIQQENIISAIEVKSNEHVTSKSLGVFNKAYHPNRCIRFSLKNFGFTNDLLSIPLYAIFCV